MFPFDRVFSLFALHLHPVGLCLDASCGPSVRSQPVGALQCQGCVSWCRRAARRRPAMPPAIPRWREQTFSGRRGLALRGAVCLLSLKELAGWKLGFGWRGPLNLALAEGNNKVTDFIYLYAVCVASCALYAIGPKSWCQIGTLKE